LKWRFKYGWGIKIIPDQSLPFLSYKFFDTDGSEIDVKEEHELV
jgi:ribonuclease G